MKKPVLALMALLCGAGIPPVTRAGGLGQPARLRLVVRNGSDVEQADAPVTSGVPWPRGLVSSPDQMRLLDRLGEELPLQAEVLSRWPDRSIKWALLDFQATVAAKGTATSLLEYGPGVGRRTAAARAILVEADADVIKVSTGAATFKVRRKGFNVLSEVLVRGQDEPIVRDGGADLRLVPSEEAASLESPGLSPFVRLPARDRVWLSRHDQEARWFHNRGFRVLDKGTGEEVDVRAIGASLDQEGKQRATGGGWCDGVFLQLSRVPGRAVRVVYPRAAEKPQALVASLGPSRVDVETEGPLRTVVRASGRFQGPDGRAAGDYVARLHFYAGKPWVRLQLTVLNREKLPLSAGLEVYPLLLDDLSLVLPLRLGVPRRFAFAGRLGYGTAHRGMLQAESDWARIVQYPARAARLSRYVVSHGGDEVASGGLAAGGVGLHDDAQGAVVCVRRQWANNPKALRVAGDGRIEVGLIPAETGPCEEFLAGRAKTHDVLLVFHGGEAPSPVDVSSAFDGALAACLAPAGETGYAGHWAANSGAVAIAPLAQTAYDQLFLSDAAELARTWERTGSYGMWNYGAQGERICRTVDFVVAGASGWTIQSASLMGLGDAVGRALVVQSGSAALLGRTQPWLVSSSDPDKGTISFAKPLDPLPEPGARATLYDPYGAFLCHRYDVAYALAREYLRRGDPGLLDAACAASLHLADVGTFHNVQGAGDAWTGACYDAALGETAHHVPGLSPEASWYAGAWLTFLLTGDRAILRGALENALFAARGVDEPDVSPQAAALACLNLCFAADVAAALSPQDAPPFEAALQTCTGRLLDIQKRTPHGLYGEKVVPAALAFEAMAMAETRGRDERIQPSLLRAAQALIRPDAFWSGHEKAGHLSNPDGSPVKPYGTADGLVIDRGRNPDLAVYGVACSLVFPHLAAATDAGGDPAFLMKGRRLERVAALFKCGDSEDFALRYRGGDRFATSWMRYEQDHPPVVDAAIGLQCRLENAADVALPDLGVGGSVIGTGFAALPDGSRAYRAQAPGTAPRAGVGAWFPLLGSRNAGEREGAIEFRICYRKGPSRRESPWLMAGDPRRQGFVLGLTGQGLELVSNALGRVPIRLVGEGVKLEPGTWHHVAVSWRPGWGTDLFLDGRALDHSPVDRVGLGYRLRLVCDPSDQTDEYLLDDLRIWKQAPRRFAAVEDRKPPAAVTDLRLEPAEGGKMLLTWTAPGDDGAQGRARRYDVRLSTQGFGPISWGGYDESADPVGAIHWAEAQRLSPVPAPQPAGSRETLLVGPFPPDRRVTIALKTEDEANASAMSNVVRTAVNHTPAADPGPPIRQAITGTEVFFDGRGSSDADYDDLTCEWSNGLKGITGSRRYGQPGTTDVELVVSDGQARARAATRLIVGDTVRISFQPPGAPAPEGFVGAAAEPYSRGRGSGWAALPPRTELFDRREAAGLGPELRTGLRLPQSAEWRLDLPDGAYSVTLAVGDPAHLSGRRLVFAEGKEICSVDLTGRTAPCVVADRRVVVSDGQLTIGVGAPRALGRPAAEGGGELNYIVVRRLP